MTIERYNTPNHPRWRSETQIEPTETTAPRPRYGRPTPRRDGRRTGETARTRPPLLQSRDPTEDHATVELRDTPSRTWLTTDLPDRSLEDIRVSVSGASVRVRAEQSDESPGIDRTITLARSVEADDVAIVYDDPVLTVIVPDENS